MTTCKRCGRQHSGYGICPQCSSEEEANKRQDRILQEQQRLVYQQQVKLDRERSEAQAKTRAEANRATFMSKLEELLKYAKDRNLISICGCLDYSSVANYKDALLAGRAKAFKDFLNTATLDDRCIDLASFGLSVNKTSTIKGIRERVANPIQPGMVLLDRTSADTFDFYVCSITKAKAALPETGYEGKELKIQDFNYIFFVAKSDLPQVLTLLATTDSEIASAYSVIEDIKQKHANDKRLIDARYEERSLLPALGRVVMMLMVAASIVIAAGSAMTDNYLLVMLSSGIGITAFIILISTGDYKDRLRSRLWAELDAELSQVRMDMNTEIINTLMHSNTNSDIHQLLE